MDSLLRISDAAAIALHAAALLAAAPSQRHSVRALAKALQVSEAHLSKVLQRLGQAGLVNSERGPMGGFQLAKDAGEITLMQVWEALEGPFNPNRCLMPHQVCSGRTKLLGNLLDKLISEFEQYFNHTTLAQVADAMSEAAEVCTKCARGTKLHKKTGSPPAEKKGIRVIPD